MSQNNRPLGYIDAQGRLIYDSVDDLAFQGEYSSSNLIYKGSARPGTATSSPNWQIALLTYDMSNNLTSITWPQNTDGVASNDYIFIWDNRASYTYS
jgi:YD repeat-containing protein